MDRPLSRRQHALADFGFAAVEIALPFVLGASPKARRLLVGSGLNAALLGAITKHELALVKLVPMRAHLALDGVFAATFLAAPLLLDEDDATTRVAVAALGASGAAVAALTNPDRA